MKRAVNAVVCVVTAAETSFPLLLLLVSVAVEPNDGTDHSGHNH